MTKIDFDGLNKELIEASSKRKSSILKDTSVPLDFDSFFASECIPGLYDTSSHFSLKFMGIEYYFYLESKGVKLFIKRAIRKLLRFLFFENFDMQKKYNAAVIQMNFLLKKRMMEMERQHQCDREKIQSLEDRLCKLEGKL